MQRPPVPPTYFFVIDVSYEAVKTGMLEIFVSTLKEAIHNNALPGGSRTQIGLLSFGSAIQLYILKAKQKQPQILVLNDLADIHIPIPDELVYNVEENKDMLLSLLDSLVGIWEGAYSGQTEQQLHAMQFCCFSRALDTAVGLFKHMGGKMVLLTANALGVAQDVQNFIQKKTDQTGKNAAN